MFTVTEANFVYGILREEMTRAEEKLFDAVEFPEEQTEDYVAALRQDIEVLQTLLDKLAA